MDLIFSDRSMSVVCVCVMALFVRSVVVRYRSGRDDQFSLALALLFPLAVMTGFYLYQDLMSDEILTRATPEQLALLFRPAFSAFLIIIGVWLNRDWLLGLAHWLRRRMVKK